MRSRIFTLRAKAGELRRAQFDGREHLVVPTVALVEGVVWAVNAPVPEFVPAEELEKSLRGWNGRFVVAGHPTINGEMTTANDPLILEKYRFGISFGARVVDKKLTMESWIDLSIDRAGSVAERIIERLIAEELVEVSVGVYMSREEVGGKFDGKDYFGIWRDIMPDHIAYLPEGEIGACSNDMGCGAPRAATVHIITTEGRLDREEVSDMKCPKHPSFTVEGNVCRACVAVAANKVRLLSVYRGADGTEPGVSNRDLYNALDTVLRATEPGYLGIEEIFPAEAEVVYACLPGDTFYLYKRGYSIDNGVATLSDDRVEVRPVTTFEDIVTAAARSACGCQTRVGGSAMLPKTKRVDALITSGKFKEADRVFLESASDEQLTVIGAPVEETPVPAPAPAPAAPVAAVPAPAVPAPAPAPLPAAAPVAATSYVGASPETAEQFIARAPLHMRDSLMEGYRTAQARHAQTIVTLKATGRCQYTDAELQAMSQQELDRLTALAGQPASSTSNLVDFSSRGLPRASSAFGTPPAPPSIGQHITSPLKKAGGAQ